MIADELDALCDSFEGCRVLAFADLSTQMILVTNASASLQREALDDLCAEAACLLTGKGNPALGTTAAQSAMVLGKTEARIFVRAASEPQDALCCICSPEADIAGLTRAAADCLDRILADDG